MDTKGIKMNPEELKRLAALLKRIRGVGTPQEKSVRGICHGIEGINYNSWQSWENGESTPRLEAFRQLARMAGWTLD